MENPRELSRLFSLPQLLFPEENPCPPPCMGRSWAAGQNGECASRSWSSWDCLCSTGLGWGKGEREATLRVLEVKVKRERTRQA